MSRRLGGWWPGQGTHTWLSPSPSPARRLIGPPQEGRVQRLGSGTESPDSVFGGHLGLSPVPGWASGPGPGRVWLVLGPSPAPPGPRPVSRPLRPEQTQACQFEGQQRELRPVQAAASWCPEEVSLPGHPRPRPGSGEGPGSRSGRGCPAHVPSACRAPSLADLGRSRLPRRHFTAVHSRDWTGTHCRPLRGRSCVTAPPQPV